MSEEQQVGLAASVRLHNDINIQMLVAQFFAYVITLKNLTEDKQLTKRVVRSVLESLSENTLRWIDSKDKDIVS